MEQDPKGETPLRVLGFVAIVEERIYQQFADVADKDENDNRSLDIREPLRRGNERERRCRENPRDQRR